MQAEVVAGAVMSAKRRCAAGLTLSFLPAPVKKVALRRGRDLRADGQAASKRQPCHGYYRGGIDLSTGSSDNPTGAVGSFTEGPKPVVHSQETGDRGGGSRAPPLGGSSLGFLGRV